MNLTISEQAGGGTGISWYYRSESGKWRVGVNHPQRRVWLSRSDDYSVILPYDDSDPCSWSTYSTCCPDSCRAFRRIHLLPKFATPYCRM